jgi:hypothetical protein
VHLTNRRRVVSAAPSLSNTIDRPSHANTPLLKGFVVLVYNGAGRALFPRPYSSWWRGGEYWVAKYPQIFVVVFEIGSILADYAFDLIRFGSSPIKTILTDTLRE